MHAKQDGTGDDGTAPSLWYKLCRMTDSDSDATQPYGDRFSTP